MSGEARASSGNAEHDPALAGLHRMSRTAGVGTQEYVAVNGVAVTALVAGAAGVVALLHPVLLVVPIAALILGMVALRQIRRSNGTQTGAPLALLGLLGALGFGGSEIYVLAKSSFERGPAMQQVDALVAQLGAELAAERYDAAYALFSDRFRQRVSRAAFDDVWARVAASPILGKVRGIRTNGVIKVQGGGVGRLAATMLLIDVSASSQPAREAAQLRETPDGWRLEDIPSWFPPPAPGGTPPG